MLGGSKKTASQRCRERCTVMVLHNGCHNMGTSLSITSYCNLMHYRTYHIIWGGGRAIRVHYRTLQSEVVLYMWVIGELMIGI